MRAGDYSGQELPFVMGMEVAGTVEQIGDGVSGLAVGDRVFGRVTRGACGGGGLRSRASHASARQPEF